MIKLASLLLVEERLLEADLRGGLPGSTVKTSPMKFNSFQSAAALRRLIRRDVRFASAERYALQYMLERMCELGFELTAGDPVA